MGDIASWIGYTTHLNWIDDITFSFFDSDIIYSKRWFYLYGLNLICLYLWYQLFAFITTLMNNEWSLNLDIRLKINMATAKAKDAISNNIQ